MLRTQTLANTILMLSFDENIPVTPMKLQKIIYFVYKRYLKATDNKLFSEPFEVWKYGPVLPSIYYEFNEYQSSPIKKFARTANGKVEVVTLSQNDAVSEAILYVWNKYKNFSGVELSKMTHESGTAWSKAFEKHGRILEDNDIKDEQEF